MNLFQKYGIKEVADVTFYSITKIGDEEFYTPVLYLDTLKVSTLEKSAEKVEAKGGKGNKKLISWSFGKDISLSLEDALFTPASMSLTWGGSLQAKLSPYLSAITKLNMANTYGKLHYSTKAYPSPALTDDEWELVFKAAEDLENEEKVDPYDGEINTIDEIEEEARKQGISDEIIKYMKRILQASMPDQYKNEAFYDGIDLDDEVTLNKELDGLCPANLKGTNEQSSEEIVEKWENNQLDSLNNHSTDSNDHDYPSVFTPFLSFSKNNIIQLITDEINYKNNQIKQIKDGNSSSQDPNRALQTFTTELKNLQSVLNNILTNDANERIYYANLASTHNNGFIRSKMYNYSRQAIGNNINELTYSINYNKNANFLTVNLWTFKWLSPQIWFVVRKDIEKLKIVGVFISDKENKNNYILLDYRRYFAASKFFRLDSWNTNINPNSDPGIYKAEKENSLIYEYFHRTRDEEEAKAMSQDIIDKIISYIDNIKKIGTIETQIYDTEVIDRMERCIVTNRYGLPISTAEQKHNLLRYYQNDQSSSYVIYYDAKTMLPLLSLSDDGIIKGWDAADAGPYDRDFDKETDTDIFRLKIGTIYYKWSRTVKYKDGIDDGILGRTFVIDADTFPDAYKIVGETYIRDQKTGKDQRFQFTIHRAQVSADTSITLQADGDPTTFSMKVDVLTPPNDVMIELKQFDVAEDRVHGGTRIIPQKSRYTYTPTTIDFKTNVDFDNPEMY